MEGNWGGRKRKSMKQQSQGESSEDEWLCARTFKASKPVSPQAVQQRVPTPRETNKNVPKQINKDQPKVSCSSKALPERKEPGEKSIGDGSRAAKFPSFSPKLTFLNNDVRPKLSKSEKNWGSTSSKRRSVIEEVESSTAIIPPKPKTNASLISNASDVVPDSLNSVNSSSSSSSKRSSSSTINKVRHSLSKTGDKTNETVQGKLSPSDSLNMLCPYPEKLPDSPVLPCTPFRADRTRRVSKVIDELNIISSLSSKSSSYQTSQSNISTSSSIRTNSGDSLRSIISRSSQSSCDETPKRSKVQSRLCGMNKKISSFGDDQHSVLETLNIEASESSEMKSEVFDKDDSIRISYTQTPKKSIKGSVTFPYEPLKRVSHEIHIEDPPTDFRIVETCHLELIDCDLETVRDNFEIEEADGKSVRCPEQLCRPMAFVAPDSPPRGNTGPRKRLTKLAGRLAAHLSGIRCERLIVRRDPRAIIVSFPISETHRNWGLTVSHVAGTGQLVIVRNRSSGSSAGSRTTLPASHQRSSTSSIFRNPADCAGNSSGTKIEESTTKTASKTLSTCSLSSDPAHRSLTDSTGKRTASIAAAECWLHLAQPYSLIRTSSRQPPAIINPIIIDK